VSADSTTRTPVEPAADKPEARSAVASVVPAAGLSPADDERREETEAERVRSYLFDPRLRTVFVVNDVIGGGADRLVAEMIDQSPRSESEYGRLTVSQGIFVDPDHPGSAAVYALVMNDHELDQFRTRLRETFPGAVTEERSRPDVVCRLAEVGQVIVKEGTPVAELVSRDTTGGGRPRTALRFDGSSGGAVSRTRVFPRAPEMLGPLTPPAFVPPLVPIEAHAGSVLGDAATETNSLGTLVGPPTPAEWPTDAPRGTVVLVWVTTRADSPALGP
jgi:hypothetical protein